MRLNISHASQPLKQHFSKRGPPVSEPPMGQHMQIQFPEPQGRLKPPEMEQATLLKDRQVMVLDSLESEKHCSEVRGNEGQHTQLAGVPSTHPLLPKSC